MFGGEIYRVPVKVVSADHETEGKNNLCRTRVNFKYISNNYHGAQGFALLTHSLLRKLFHFAQKSLEEKCKKKYDLVLCVRIRNDFNFSAYHFLDALVALISLLQSLKFLSYLFRL